MSDVSRSPRGPRSLVASRIAGLLEPLVIGRPLAALALVLALAGVGGFVVTGLTFDSSFAALLPEDDPVVTEVNAARERVGGLVELVVAVGGKREERLPFGRALVARLRQKRWIARADVEFPIDFFTDRALYLIPLDKLEKIRSTVQEKIERAKARANPLYVDLEEDDKTKRADEEELKTMLADLKGVGKVRQGGKARQLKRHFVSPDGAYLFVRVTPVGASSEIGKSGNVLQLIKEEVARGKPAERGLTVRYAGGRVKVQHQNRRMKSDFRRAAWIALVLILLLMTVHVRNLVAPVVLVLPLVSGVVVTLALVTLTYGQVNLVTGFLVSALIGLGIDFELHLYLRYLERLHEGGDRRAAMRAAIGETLPACMTAAFTTASAFYAMAIADFRGFAEYGVIAGSGVLVALLFAFVGLPPLALLISRKGRRTGVVGGALGGGSAWWARGIVAVGVVALVAAAYVAPRVRWHSNFHELQGKSEVVDFVEKVSKDLGGTLTPGAIVVADLGQARRAEAYLARRMKREGSLIKRYLSFAALTPKLEPRRLEIIAELRKRFSDALARGRLKKEDAARLREGLKLTRVEPWSIAEIPEVFRRQLQTRDGRGMLVVIWPEVAMHEDFNIIRWATELRQIQDDLSAMFPVQIADEARVAARVIQSMWDDAPPVLLAAALAVLFFLIIDFRRPRPVILVYGVLAVGVVWMLGAMVFFGVEVNVFNQAVLATVLGLGIDNAVHIQHRYDQEGPGRLLHVVLSTGSASFLATATTAIGFGATITAFHMGLRSLGELSLIGLGATLLASTVFFPALLRLLEERRRRGGDRPQSVKRA